MWMLSFEAVSPARPVFRSWAFAAALVICAFGALLRLDAFTGKYGPLDRPAWARILTHDVAPLARHLRPSTVVWRREPKPYVGGDPIAYLQYARAMTSFYQPHVREPVFLAETRLALWALDGQDAGVSLASAAGSVATVFATYLLGAALISPAGGLVAAALMAIEYDAITWAVDGWRDDTFAAFFVLTTWALIRFRDAPSFGRAVGLGLLAAAACLTRITALSFVLPAFAWIAIERGPDRRNRQIHVAVATVILVAGVVPYLVSCAIATGNPFFAINDHTRYYRLIEGTQTMRPVGTAGYLYDKFARRPYGTIDVAAVGLLVRPFVTKWHPYGIWLRGLSTLLSWAGLAGLAMWLFDRRGRFVIVILLAALVPYAFTWNLGGGGEWRFMMHVYSIYLVAAVAALAAAGRLCLRAVASRGRAPDLRDDLRRTARRSAVGVAIAGVWIVFYGAAPWLVKREAIANGDAVNFQADGRDRVFYRRGWSSSLPP
ncbi:MAG TPA: glycosyltransferase family 39 protein [Vicinamibacterales bacterium]|nr:glycosyltransferase family 39 protein [Vicinamibacterales bacterium]